MTGNAGKYFSARLLPTFREGVETGGGAEAFAEGLPLAVPAGALPKGLLTAALRASCSLLRFSSASIFAINTCNVCCWFCIIAC